MKKNNNILLSQLRELILEARQAAYRNVNTLQVVTNFLIGKTIVEYEQRGAQRAVYGKEQLASISRKLTKEFGRGYSVDNLQLMRAFYSTYQNRFGFNDSPIPETLSRKSQQKSYKALALKASDQNYEALPRISSVDKHLLKLTWTHFVLLLKMDEDERPFYEIESAVNNWSTRELERQYNSSLYERLALSRNKKKVKQLSKKGQILQRPLDLIKQPYILEFLGLKEETTYTESELETAIINRIEHFLLELGKGFLFEARQKRISFEGDDFFVDLVFYNRLLRCYVLFDLKIGKLTHKDIGQMQMYVNYFDRELKLKNENNTIGIVLCKHSNKAVVEFTLPEKQKQIFAREYKLYLPSKEELKKQIENL
jgi:predicted nuclease of restriction endonuclease-like (RecB) superfamily